jgi:hypothetical protein
VQEQGTHLSKLIYLNKEEFNLLKVLRFDFLKRTRRFFENLPKSHFVTQKHRLECPVTQDLNQGNGNTCPDYEPTNILLTRNSLFWRWRRVKEYYRDFLDKEDNGEAKEVYALIHS